MPTFIHKNNQKEGGKMSLTLRWKKKKKKNLPPIKRDGKNKQKLYAETCIGNHSL